MELEAGEAHSPEICRPRQEDKATNAAPLARRDSPEFFDPRQSTENSLHVRLKESQKAVQEPTLPTSDSAQGSAGAPRPSDSQLQLPVPSDWILSELWSRVRSNRMTASDIGTSFWLANYLFITGLYRLAYKFYEVCLQPRYLGSDIRAGAACRFSLCAFDSMECATAAQTLLLARHDRTAIGGKRELARIEIALARLYLTECIGWARSSSDRPTIDVNKLPPWDGHFDTLCSQTMDRRLNWFWELINASGSLSRYTTFAYKPGSEFPVGFYEDFGTTWSVCKKILRQKIARQFDWNHVVVLPSNTCAEILTAFSESRLFTYLWLVYLSQAPMNAFWTHAGILSEEFLRGICRLLHQHIRIDNVSTFENLLQSDALQERAEELDALPLDAFASQVLLTMVPVPVGSQVHEQRVDILRYLNEKDVIPMLWDSLRLAQRKWEGWLRSTSERDSNTTDLALGYANRSILVADNNESIHFSAPERPPSTGHSSWNSSLVSFHAYAKQIKQKSSQLATNDYDARPQPSSYMRPASVSSSLRRLLLVAKH